MGTVGPHTTVTVVFGEGTLATLGFHFLAGNLAHIFVCANPAHPHNLGPRDVWPPISVKPRLLCIQPTLTTLAALWVCRNVTLFFAPWAGLNPSHPSQPLVFW